MRMIDGDVPMSTGGITVNSPMLVKHRAVEPLGTSAGAECDLVSNSTLRQTYWSSSDGLEVPLLFPGGVRDNLRRDGTGGCCR